MYVIGLTGPSGSGKGAVSSLLEKYNIPSIDTDDVYHKLLIPPSDCFSELVSVFGKGIIGSDGQIDRTALGKIVFADMEKKNTLQHITHKYILGKTDELLIDCEKKGYVAAAVDAPLLYESGYDAKCDFVIAIIAPRGMRLERIICRDKITEDAALQRINAQQPDEYYTSRAKYSLVNDGDLAKLDRDLEDILINAGVIKQ